MKILELLLYLVMIYCSSSSILQSIPLYLKVQLKMKKVLNDMEYNVQLQSCFADYVVVGSDSGRIVILEYIPQKNTFEKVSNKTLIFNMTIDSYFIELFQ